jgi:hypothetical protein
MPKLKQNRFPESNYEFFQPNPSWDNTKARSTYRHQDCPIRGICAATGKTWNEVYDLMTETGKEVCDAQTSDSSIELALSRLGFTKHTAKVVKGQKRATVASFAREHADKPYVLRVAGHIVGVRNGKYLDCWDCGSKCVYTYYEYGE